MCFNRRKKKYNFVQTKEGNMANGIEFDYQKRIEELMEIGEIESNYELARICSVDRGTVTRWLTPGTKLTPESVEKLSAAFDITLSQFYQMGLVDRRGDAQTKKLRHIWKTLTEREKEIFIEVGKAAVKVTSKFKGK